MNQKISVISNERGVAILEASTALGTFFFMILSFVAFAQLVSVRGVVYDQLVQETRRRAVTELECGGASVIDSAVAESKDRFISGLASRGIRIPSNDVQIVANESVPGNVTNWQFTVQLNSQCAICRMLRPLGVVNAASTINMSIPRESTGCF